MPVGLAAVWLATKRRSLANAVAESSLRGCITAWHQIQAHAKTLSRFVTHGRGPRQGRRISTTITASRHSEPSFSRRFCYYSKLRADKND